ncbi:MAG: fibronectin type III domain-containing protein [Verrucomicrobia bacterium]|nr:fibronectin type III domain-containing protein [Verrucomicrobiota bacterium]
MTHALELAITAHWQTLSESDPKQWDRLSPHLQQMQLACKESITAAERHVAAQLAAWEAKRAAFQPEATVGGPPRQPGTLDSADWGTHWILFHWDPPSGGCEPWGYRLERSTDNREFFPVSLCVETEETLLNQPQGVKLYYRVVGINGFGDGPPSAVFGIKFDSELVDHRKRASVPRDVAGEAQ